jgi:hypothetical protein
VEGEEPYIISKYSKEEKAFDTLMKLVTRCCYALIGVDRASRKPYITYIYTFSPETQLPILR